MEGNFPSLPETVRLKPAMKDRPSNPFNYTKADGFTDQEINDLWVDISPHDGFSKLAKLTSPMPMYIVGGKGSGKTHLMKYFSYPVQKIRHANDPQAGIRADGYLGVYLKCGGLNASRFEGKKQSDDAWASIFAWSMDLWIAEHLVGTVLDLAGGGNAAVSNERDACVEIAELFDAPSEHMPDTLLGLHRRLRDLQRELDTAVNNCAVTGGLKATIHATRGNLVFGIPIAISRHIAAARGVRCLYLLDEFENLSLPQQKYVNTLIRERKEPVSFKIGARLYGVRTHSTYCADEDNKEGSEHETLPLDAWLRADKRKYAVFARRLIVRRLGDYGKVRWPNASDREIRQLFASQFEDPAHTRLARKETAFIRSKYEGRERPYFEMLRRVLQTGLTAGVSPGVASEADIDEIITALKVAELPLLEKVNILLLYKDWSSQRNLRESAKNISADCHRCIETREASGRYARVMHHFRADLLAQLRRDCGGSRRQRQSYTGIDTLIAVSWGIPRHLLILLKGAVAWALFNGEEPFLGSPLSIRAQQVGVNDAAEWFYKDAEIPGVDGKRVQDSIVRLATLFREIRFSHKPSECSVVAFSYDQTKISDDARRVIQLAINWSLLIDVGPQRDRNSLRVDMKLQLNRMLAPLWDLPIFRRGVLALSPDEVNAIFDDGQVGAFQQIVANRVARMTAPCFGRKPQQPPPNSGHRLLPGFDDA